MNQSKKYIAPTMEVIIVENEGVMASSANIGGLEEGTWGPTTRSASKQNYETSPLNDLEDIINDFLTY